LKISGDSPNRPFVSKDPPAGKEAARVNSLRDGSGQVQNKPAVRDDSPLRPVPAGSADLASLLKLPPDNLSRSLIAFARFFGLSLDPKFLATLRRDALGAALLGTTGQEAAAPGVASKEAAALGAAAAADKGIKLGEKALREYAAAIQGRPESFVRTDSTDTQASEKSRGDESSQLLSETDPDGHGGNHGAPQDESDDQNGRRASHQDTKAQGKSHEASVQTSPGFLDGSAPELQCRITEILEERPLLDLINRIPGKNGRWIVIPFSFCEDNVEFAVSLHILTKGERSWPCLHGHDRASEEPKGTKYPSSVIEGSSISADSLVSGNLNADIRVSRSGREQTRWLFSLEKAEDGIRAELGVLSASGPWNVSAAEKERVRQELAAALDVPLDRVSIRAPERDDGPFRESAFLFAEARENSLRSVNEEV